MTLPRNFPGRKEQRRIAALDRLIARWRDAQTIPTQAAHELDILRERIALGGVHSTKKDRSLRGKLRRE